MNDRDPVPPNLELSQEEIKRIFTSTAESVIRRVTAYYEPQNNPGVYEPQSTAMSPKRFMLDLPIGFMQLVYHPQNDEIVTAASIEYASPHRLDAPHEPSQLGDVSNVLLQIHSQLAHDLHKVEDWHLICSDAGYEATRDVEYLKDVDGKARRVSPAGLWDEHDGSEVPADLPLETVAADLASQRTSFTMDDGEKLQRVAEYIDAADQL